MKIRTLIVIAAAGMGLAFVATPAQAEKAPNNCVVDVSEGTMACYGTFGEAIAKATGGRVAPKVSTNVRKAADDPELARQIRELSEAQAAAQDERYDYVLSIEYEDSGFDDDSLIFVGNYLCSASIDDWDYGQPRMPPGWNDQIGSFRTWTDVNPTGWCYVQHFEHDDFLGGWVGPTASDNDMGDMDDETSSIRWT